MLVVAKAYNNLGLVLKQRGRTEEAVRAYRTAVELDPRFGLARINLAVAVIHQGAGEGTRRREEGKAAGEGTRRRGKEEEQGGRARKEECF